MEIDAAHMLHCIVDGGNDGGDDDILHFFRINAKIIEKRDDFDAKLIGRAVYLSAQPPGMQELVPIENTAFDVGIAQIYHK